LQYALLLDVFGSHLSPSGAILSEAKRTWTTALRAAVRGRRPNDNAPISFNRSWLTTTVVAIAQGMYDSRDFSAMLLLADALVDSGCENEDILNHCRDAKQVHVRGCWLTDMVLGKE
jgi:hypothetical protein